MCCSALPRQHVCYPNSRYIFKLSILKLSKLHLHNDVELESEDLLNIVIRNVAHVGIVDVVEVAEEDGVGMPTWATFWLAMPNLIIPILPVRPSGRHSLPGFPRNPGEKLAVVLASNYGHLFVVVVVVVRGVMHACCYFVFCMLQ